MLSFNIDTETYRKRARKDKDVDTMDDEPDENQHATTVPEGTSEPFMSKADFFCLMPGLYGFLFHVMHLLLDHLYF